MNPIGPRKTMLKLSQLTAVALALCASIASADAKSAPIGAGVSKPKGPICVKAPCNPPSCIGKRCSPGPTFPRPPHVPRSINNA